MTTFSTRASGLLNPSQKFSSRHFSRSAMQRRQNRLSAAYYRGGTSRAVFFQQKDLPTDRTQWNAIFLGVLGSPDPYGRQLDGLGGGISSLSKICVVAPSNRPDADVDYTFAAVGVKNDEVDFSSNCGNMSTAVGPFAVDHQLVDVRPGYHEAVTVRIYNINTGKIIHSTFPVDDGEASTTGDFEIDGVADKAARVQLDFVNPAGSKTGKLLPTGQLVDTFDGVRTTCIDVGNPCCFIQAASLGVRGDLTPDEIENHPTLLVQLDSIRRQAGAAMGLAETADQVPGSIPKICMVSPSTGARETDLTIRSLSVGQPHKAVPVTVALSIAAAANLSGSTVEECILGQLIDPTGVTFQHASGNLTVQATFNSQGELEAATVFRTARRLMEGTIFWK